MLPSVIDAHIHWRDPENHPYESLSDGVDEDGERTGAQAETYLPASYLADMAGVDVAGVVHIEAEWTKADPVGETRWLHGLAEQDRAEGLPLVIVAHADLASDAVEPVLEGHAAMPLTRGIRQMLCRVDGRPDLCWADQDYIDLPQWRANYALLAKYGLDFDLMCFAHQMQSFAKLAAVHPDIPVHVEHAGLPWDHSEQGRLAWRTGLKALAELDHVDIKISGFGNTVPNWTTQKIRDYVLQTIEIFGTSRVSFASNAPTDLQFGPISEIWDAFDTITRDFSVDERAAMFAGNARRAYRMSGN